MESGCLKVGDIIIMKPKWLLLYGLPLSENKAEIIEMNGNLGLTNFRIKIRNYNWEYVEYTGNLTTEDFYIANSVNVELLQLINNDEIQFNSFVGHTVDGKKISICVETQNNDN